MSITFRALGRFFGYLKDEGEIGESPMKNMHQPRIPEAPVPVITDDQLRKLVDSCSGKDFTSRRDLAIVRLFIDTGCRRAEIANLTVDDVDLNAQEIRVVESKSKEVRFVPFGVKTAKAISAYLRVRRESTWAHLPNLWLTERNRGPLGADGIRQMFERRRKALGIPRLYAHKFRHTFAHRWLADGSGHEADLMRIAGWKSPQMLARYGGSMADIRARAAARRLGLGDRI